MQLVEVRIWLQMIREQRKGERTGEEEAMTPFIARRDISKAATNFFF